MPHAIAVWAAGAFLTAAPGLGIAAAGIVGWGAGLAASIAIGAGLSLASSALMGRPKLGAPRGAREMVVKTTTGPRAIVYGEVTCGGTLVFMGTCGAKNQYLDFVIALAGHEVQAITDVWVDDTLITNAEIGSGSAYGGAVGGTGQYKPRDGNPVLWVHKYLGSWMQTWSPVLTATDGTGYDEWTSDHRGRSIAYVHIRCRRNGDAFESGPPQSFRFRVQGAKCYDPRLDSTNGGSGPHRLDDATTWTYTRNPAVIAADYITGGTLSNDLATPKRKRGFGASTADVDWTSVISAAGVCEETVVVPVAGGGSETQYRYLCDGVVYPSDDTPDADCLDALLTSMIGQVTFTAGKYFVYAGSYTTPVYTLNETDLAGSVKYVTAHGRSERYNVVRGTRYDADQGAAVEFLSRTDTSYQTTDGRALYHDIELPATTNEYRAQRIAQTILRRSREQKTLIWPGQLSAAKIAVWETCYVTCAELGLSNKVFRCIERKVRPFGSDDPFVTLTLREENASTYADPLLTDYGSPSVAIDPGPTPDMLDEPTGLVATSVPGGVELRWVPGALPIPLGVRFEVWAGTSSASVSTATLAWSGATSKAFLTHGDTATRYYWVRAVRGPATSSFEPAGSGIGGTGGPLNANYTLIAKGTHPVEIGVDSFHRVGGAAAWNTGVYSVEKFRGAYVAARPRSTSTYQMIGFSTNPLTSSSYADAMFMHAWYAAAGQLHIYEQGIHVYSGGAYTPQTQLSITYDDLFVRYLVDGVLVREQAIAPQRVYHLNAVMYDDGAGWDGVRFGPMAVGAYTPVLTLTPTAAMIVCDSGGTPVAGQLPLIIDVRCMVGSCDLVAGGPIVPVATVTASGVSWGGSVFTNIVVTVLTAETGYVDVSLSFPGTPWGTATARCTIAKIRS